MRQRVKSTSIEQSRKLLELGFDPNSADMHFHYKETKIEALRWELLPYGMTTKENYSLRIERLNVGGLWKHKDGTPMSGEEIFEKMYGNDVPSWSEGALMKLLPRGIDGLGSLSVFPDEHGEWNVMYGVPTNKQYFRVSKSDLLEALYCAICVLDSMSLEKQIVKLMMKEWQRLVELEKKGGGQ